MFESFTYWNPLTTLWLISWNSLLKSLSRWSQIAEISFWGSSNIYQTDFPIPFTSCLLFEPKDNKCPYFHNGFETLPGLSRHLAHDAACRMQLKRLLKVDDGSINRQLRPIKLNGSEHSTVNKASIFELGDDLMTHISEGAGIRADGNEEWMKNRFHVESYLGNAGWTFGTCPDAFNRKINNDAHHATNHLHNQDTWDLAKWLMTSNLSGSSRDKYFKLKAVSSRLRKSCIRLTQCFRTSIYLGTPTTSSCGALIYCQQVQSGIRLKLPLKGIMANLRKWKRGWEIHLLALRKL